MDFPLTLLNLAGSVALLLWGVHMARTGVQRAFGAKLRNALGAALRNRLAAFAAGLGVTAVLQSSTATGLMVASFAAGGFVDLHCGVGGDARRQRRHDADRPGAVVRRRRDRAGADPDRRDPVRVSAAAATRDLGRAAIR